MMNDLRLLYAFITGGKKRDMERIKVEEKEI